MSSTRRALDRRSGDVPPGGSASSRLDRVIAGLVWWWRAVPLVLFAPLIATALGVPEVRDEFGRVFGLAAVGSAVGAPAVGFVVALVGGRRQALRRFAVMGAVSGGLVLSLWGLLVLLAECPAGHHC
ncbi:hypothetical protein AB0D29_13380 [Streptomyces sp. NPDC048424]|uniref:hypothetical protein n=1 Tax=Streptomyces sp. NPDC048424 TaxID=3155265 RepID=UPI003439EF32